MMTLLIVAAALADTSSIATVTGAVEGGEAETIVVEGRRSEHDWVMPDLDYGPEEACPVLKETRLPGFGTVRFGLRCASRPTGEWIPFQN